MRLARKLTLPLAISIFVVIATSGFVSVRRELRQFEEDVIRDHHLVGVVLATAAEDQYRDEGESAARSLVKEASSRDDHVHAEYYGLQQLEPQVRATMERGGESHRVDWGVGQVASWVPVRPYGATLGAIALIEPVDEEKSFVREMVVASVIATLLLSAVGAAVALGLGRWIVGVPIARLVEQARRIGAGERPPAMRLSQNDELGELAREFDKMSEDLDRVRASRDEEAARRLHTLEQLRHADRLATVGKLASGVAHELGTPLNVIHARAKLIANREVDGAEAQRNAQIVVDEAEQISRIIHNLMNFARRSAPVETVEDIGEIAAQTLHLLEPLAKKRGIRLRVEPGEEPDCKSVLLANHGSHHRVDYQPERFANRAGTPGYQEIFRQRLPELLVAAYDRINCGCFCCVQRAE